jgi:hypothetical protein
MGPLSESDFVERLASACRWLEAVQDRPLTAQEEAEWQRTETRLAARIAAILQRAQADPRRAAPVQRREGNWLLRWAWAPVFAAALALIAVHQLRPPILPPSSAIAVLVPPPRPPSPSLAATALPPLAKPVPQTMTPQAAEAKLGMPRTASLRDGKLTLEYPRLELVFQNNRLVEARAMEPAPEPRASHARPALARLSEPLPPPPSPAPAAGFVATLAWAGIHGPQLATPELAIDLLGQPAHASFQDGRLIFLYPQIQLTYQNDRLVSVNRNRQAQK